MRRRERRDGNIRMTDFPGPGLGIALALLTLLHAPSAVACACCTNEGQRQVATVALDSGKRQEIESLRFGDTGQLQACREMAR
jgi:hypothetical protein